MEIPSSATPPPPLTPRTDRPQRFYELWVLLCIVLGFWILGALYGYFAGPGEEAAKPAQKTGVVQEQAVTTLYLSGSLTGSAKEIPVTGDAATQLRELMEEAASDAENSTESGRQALTLAHELGEEMPAEAVASLEKSKRDIDKAFLELYSAEELTEARADELAQEVGGGTYLKQMAAAHARLKAGNSAARDSLVSVGHFTPLFLVMAMIAVCFLGGIIFLAVGVITHRSKSWKTAGFFSRMEEAQGDMQAGRMAVYTLLFVFMGFGMAAIHSDSIWVDVGGMALMIPVIMALYAVTRHFGPGSVRASLGNREHPWRLAGLGVAGFMANLPIFLFMAMLITPLIQFLPEPSHPINEMISNSPSPVTLLGLYVTAAIFAPVLEELTFRGMLFPALQTLLRRPVAAMLIQALIFAAVHPQGPLLWPMLGLVGFTSAFLAHKTGSLIPGLVLHAVHNAFILTIGLAFG